MNSRSFTFISVLLIACLTSAATDIYAPSLAIISKTMQAPISLAQFSLSIFMVGLAISQLIYGPLSEGVGRRLPLVIGLVIFIVGSVVCMLSHHIQGLILGRLIQGFGAGACSTLWRSIFRDVYQGNDLAKYGGYLSIVITFVVPAVPILGGYLQYFVGWQASFGFLILYGALILLLLPMLQETSKYHHIERLRPRFIAQTFRQLLTSPIFMGYSICVFFSYGAFFSWFAVGPVLMIKQIGLSPVEFGWLTFAIGSIAMATAGAFNGALVARLGAPTMLRIGWGIMYVAGFLLCLGHFIFGVNLYAIIFPVFLFSFGVTLIWPNAFAGAFTPFGTIAGYAGSLYSFLQLGGGAVMGSITARLPATSALPLAVIFMLSPLLAWLFYEGLVNRVVKLQECII